MDPFLPAIGVGALGAATSFAGGLSQSSAARNSQRSVRRAEAIQVGQIRDQRDFEDTINRRRTDRAAASLRTTLAAAGRVGDLSTNDATGQISTDGAINSANIRSNARNNIARVRSGAESQVSQLQASVQNPFLLAFNSVLQGAQAGLSTYLAVDAVNGAIGTAEANAQAAAQAAQQSVRPVAVPQRQMRVII
jgi:hypothetical protein